MEITSRSIPASSWSGFSATTICIVEQFGLATIPLWPSSGVGIDLGDDQRHVVVHPEVAGVVDDHGARLDEARRPLGADRAAGRGEDEVEALDRVLAQRPALEHRRRSTRSRGRRSARRRRGRPPPPGTRARRAARGSSSRPARSRPELRLCIRRPPSGQYDPGSGGDRRPVLGAGGVLGRDRVRAELERLVQGPNRVGDAIGGDHAGDLDRRGGDHLDVDPLPAEHLEDAWRRRRGGSACRRRRSRPCRSARRCARPG